MSTRRVEIHAADLPTVDATVKVATDLAEAICDGKEFQALVWIPQSMERPRGLQVTQSVRMLKAIRPGLVAHCTGLVFIADEANKTVHRRSADAEARLWECSVTTVSSENDVRAWLASCQESRAR